MTFRVLGDGLPVNQVGGLEFYPKDSFVFSPVDIDGLQLWLKADAGTFQDSGKTTPAASDGDVVGAWADQSGQGNDATQGTTANKPLLKLNIANTTRPVIRFDGANDLLSFPDFASSFTEGEMFIVLKADANTAPSNGQGGLWLFGDAINDSHYPWTDGRLYDTFGTTARKNQDDPVTDLTQFNLYNPSSKTNEWKSRINTVEFFTTGTNTVAFKTIMQIGKSQSAAGFYFDGDMAELVMYNSVLSTADRQSVETYLNGRYAIF